MGLLAALSCIECSDCFYNSLSRVEIGNCDIVACFSNGKAPSILLFVFSRIRSDGSGAHC
jgi:hypothetical protein